MPWYFWVIVGVLFALIGVGVVKGMWWGGGDDDGGG